MNREFLENPNSDTTPVSPTLHEAPAIPRFPPFMANGEPVGEVPRLRALPPVATAPMHRFAEPLTARMADFLREIGLEVVPCDLPEPCFLPGIQIDQGRLLVDESRLLYPGDLLHEAGHLAVIPAENRTGLHGSVTTDLGDEIGAIAWSYAAALHLEIDPAVVFHPNGYRGSSDTFLANFNEGRYVGVPLLQWMGLTLEENPARERELPPYPHMLKWLRD